MAEKRSPIGRPSDALVEIMGLKGFITTDVAAALTGVTQRSLARASAREPAPWRSERRVRWLFVHRAELLAYYGITEAEAKKIAAAQE